MVLWCVWCFVLFCVCFCFSLLSLWQKQSSTNFLATSQENRRKLYPALPLGSNEIYSLWASFNLDFQIAKPVERGSIWTGVIDWCSSTHGATWSLGSQWNPRGIRSIKEGRKWTLRHTMRVSGRGRGAGLGEGWSLGRTGEGNERYRGYKGKWTKPLAPEFLLGKELSFFFFFQSHQFTWASKVLWGVFRGEHIYSSPISSEETKIQKDTFFAQRFCCLFVCFNF